MEIFIWAEHYSRPLKNQRWFWKKVTVQTAGVYIRWLLYKTGCGKLDLIDTSKPLNRVQGMKWFLLGVFRNNFMKAKSWKIADFCQEKKQNKTRLVISLAFSVSLRSEITYQGLFVPLDVLIGWWVSQKPFLQTRTCRDVQSLSLLPSAVLQEVTARGWIRQCLGDSHCRAGAPACVTTTWTATWTLHKSVTVSIALVFVFPMCSLC